MTIGLLFTIHLLSIYIWDFYLHPNTMEAKGICGAYSIGKLDLRNLVPKHFSKNSIPVTMDNPQNSQQLFLW